MQAREKHRSVGAGNGWMGVSLRARRAGGTSATSARAPTAGWSAPHTKRAREKAGDPGTQVPAVSKEAVEPSYEQRGARLKREEPLMVSQGRPGTGEDHEPGEGSNPPRPWGAFIAQHSAMPLSWSHQVSDGLSWACSREREPIRKGEDPSLGRRHLAGCLSFDAPPYGWGIEEGRTQRSRH